MFEDEERPKKTKVVKKITKQRLKNIALYYLKRYETSVDNLRRVLRKRINDYAYQNPEFNKNEAYEWGEEILKDFEGYGYINDERFAEMRVRGYISAGKSPRYIQGKLREKGIPEHLVSDLLDHQAYDPQAAALRLAKKKRIGPYRAEEIRAEYRQKDMGTLIRAGFDYDTVLNVLNDEGEELEQS